MKRKAIKFNEAVNWEFVHTHHPAGKGKITPSGDPYWIGRIIDHARRNGFTGQITLAGAARIINQHLY